jgi:hypothetical protein
MGRSARPRPILVTGSHRSGSTWVGRMLSASREVGYVSEPFHVRHPRGLFGAETPYWYTYVTRDNERLFRPYLEQTLAFRYGFARELGSLPQTWLELWRNANGSGGSPGREPPLPAPGRRMLREASEFLRYRLRGARPLLKDPMALFSAEWIAASFDAQVVVLVRHPAAFYTSLKRLDWRFPFSHLASQPLLLRDHLGEYRDQILEYARSDQPLVDQAALLWKVLYSTVLRYRAAHPDWLVCRHEDISADPVAAFRMLYERLGLTFTPEAESVVRSHSSASNPAEAAPMDDSSIARDSRSNAWGWKSRLTQAEVEHLRARVEDVSSHFYAEADW